MLVVARAVVLVACIVFETRALEPSPGALRMAEAVRAFRSERRADFDALALQEAKCARIRAAIAAEEQRPIKMVPSVEIEGIVLTWEPSFEDESAQRNTLWRLNLELRHEMEIVARRRDSIVRRQADLRRQLAREVMSLAGGTLELREVILDLDGSFLAIVTIDGLTLDPEILHAVLLPAGTSRIETLHAMRKARTATSPTSSDAALQARAVTLASARQAMSVLPLDRLRSIVAACQALEAVTDPASPPSPGAARPPGE